MRKLWVKAWLTLDGVFDADTMDPWWQPPGRLEYIVEEYKKGDVYLLGRTTYEMLWPGWSTQTTGDGPGRSSTACKNMWSRLRSPPLPGKNPPSLEAMWWKNSPH